MMSVWRAKLREQVAPIVVALTILGAGPGCDRKNARSGLSSSQTEIVAAIESGAIDGSLKTLRDDPAQLDFHYVAPESELLRGVTPLIRAIERGDESTTQALLNAGASAGFAAVDGVTPLMTAAHFGRVGIARRLVELGADVKATVPDTGEAALHIACSRGQTAIVRLLIDGGTSIEMPRRQGVTPVMVAAGASNDDVFWYLKDLGADLLKRTEGGSTALHIAADGGDAGRIRALVDAGNDLNATGRSGMTPLLAAIRSSRLEGQLERVRTLLELGSDPNKASREGETPLAVACHFEYTAGLVDELLRSGANTELRDPNYSATPLATVVREGSLVKVRLLLDASANPLATDDDGESVLDLATRMVKDGWPVPNVDPDSWQLVREQILKMIKEAVQ